MQYEKKKSKVRNAESPWSQHKFVPWRKLRNAAVMKIVNTFLKTSGSNIEESNPEGLQAIITMAYNRKKKDYVAHTGKINTKTSVQGKGHHYLESQYKEGPHTIKTSE